MRQVRSSDADILEYQRGDWLVSLRGLPVMLAGLLGLTVLVDPSLIPGSARAIGDGRAGIAIVALLATIAGGWAVLGREHLRIDRTAQTISRWRTLMVPFARKTAPWGEFTSVGIYRELRGQKNGYTVYPVRLRGSPAFDVAAPRDVQKARRIGEDVAKFMGFAFADASSGETFTREAGRLDESLSDRMRRTGEVPEPGAAPGAMRTRVEQRAGTVVVAFPREPFDLIGLAFVALFAAFPLLAFGRGVVHFGEVIRGDRVVGTTLCAFLVIWYLPLLSGIRQSLLSLVRRITVEVDPVGLRIVTRNFMRSVELTIPAAELEELRLETHGAFSDLTAISDRTITRFGRGVPADELAWVQKTMQVALAATRPFR